MSVCEIISWSICTLISCGVSYYRGYKRGELDTKIAVSNGDWP